MAAYETFPEIEGLSVVENAYEIDDPVIEGEFENGWADIRTLRARPRYDNMAVTYIVNTTDKDTILNFLIARRLRVEPFFYRHNKLGTLLVRLKAPKLPVTFEILGDPVWYRMELIFEEQY